MLKVSFVIVALLSPVLAMAAGLVPCGGAGEPGCDDICYFLVLVKNVADWLAIIFGIVLVITIIYAGLRLVTSGGDASAKTDARRLISQALVGYALILGGWFIVGTFLSFFAPGSSYMSLSTAVCEK